MSPARAVRRRVGAVRWILVSRASFRVSLTARVQSGRAFGSNPTLQGREVPRAIQRRALPPRHVAIFGPLRAEQGARPGLGRPTAACAAHSTARATFYKPEWQCLWGRTILSTQVAARTGGPVDISKLFELEIAQWTEVDLRVAPRLVDDTAWVENQDADEFMLQPGGIDAITEFWNSINDGAGSGGVGLHGDFNMTGSYDEWEEARRLVERGERKLSDYGGELPGTEPPDEWKR